MLISGLKSKLAGRTPIVGSWMALADPGVAEIMARAGFDWLTIDMEHSAITLSQAQELIRVISLCGVCSLVRLPSNDADLAKRVLDAGATGVIVPMVKTREEAEQAVTAAKYPPAGRRSVGLARAQDYGPGFDRYVAAANAETVVIVQIEHADAVANVDAILTVPGVDGFIVGPYDLSASLGIPGQLGHPRVTEALGRVVEAGRRHNVARGLHVVWPGSDEFIRRVADGFTLLAYSVDFLLLGEACRRDLAVIRRQLASGRV